MTPYNLLDQLKKHSLFIRDQRAFRDIDVATMYRISPSKLRSVLKSHSSRFPSDFVIKRNGFIFLTEGGVLMLSSVLKTSLAEQISVGIVRELFSFPNN